MAGLVSSLWWWWTVIIFKTWIINTSYPRQFFILQAERNLGRREESQAVQLGKCESLNPAQGTVGCVHLATLLSGNSQVSGSQICVFPTSGWTSPPSCLDPDIFPLTGRSKDQRSDRTSNFSSLIPGNVHSIRNWILKWNSPVPHLCIRFYY